MRGGRCGGSWPRRAARVRGRRRGAGHETAYWREPEDVGTRSGPTGERRRRCWPLAEPGVTEEEFVLPEIRDGGRFPAGWPSASTSSTTWCTHGTSPPRSASNWILPDHILGAALGRGPPRTDGSAGRGPGVRVSRGRSTFHGRGSAGRGAAAARTDTGEVAAVDRRRGSSPRHPAPPVQPADDVGRHVEPVARTAGAGQHHRPGALGSGQGTAVTGGPPRDPGGTSNVALNVRGFGWAPSGAMAPSHRNEVHRRETAAGVAAAWVRAVTEEAT